MLSFIKDRPPLMIFFLCLFTSSLTLFYFAYYIKNTDIVLDSDKIDEWNQLLKHFNTLKICLAKSSDITASVTDQYEGYVEVQTLAKISISEFSNYSGIQGSLILDDWHSNCPKKDPKPKSLGVSFNVPQNISQNTGEVTICVNIKGSAEYLPTFSEPNCGVEKNKPLKLILGFLTTTKSTYGPNWCKTGFQPEINFIPHTKDNFKDILTNNEKNVIYIHLLWTSCILFLIAVIIIIYGISQSSNRLEKCNSFIRNR